MWCYVAQEDFFPFRDICNNFLRLPRNDIFHHHTHHTSGLITFGKSRRAARLNNCIPFLANSKLEVAGSTQITQRRRRRVSNALALWVAWCRSRAQKLPKIWVFLDLGSQSFLLHANEWGPAKETVSRYYNTSMEQGGKLLWTSGEFNAVYHAVKKASWIVST